MRFGQSLMGAYGTFRQEGEFAEVANVKKGPQRVFVGFRPRLRCRLLEKFLLWRCSISMSTELALATSGG